ncbi:GAF and ANTAR domain-containing protein [Brevibacterium sp. 'Marine']|uniref:ANTAR domain-containing protein n=1 Tax=Brevibacterium sp. 'Marine' TaxID=2725563 RepID=UPI00145D9EEC|nr:GAF and ANTAR domain-containing protein [Brevibacterium sp. 'Marine']
MHDNQVEATDDRPTEPCPAEGADNDADSPALTAEIGEWARSMAQESDDLVLEMMVQEALRVIPGVDYASLSIVGRDRRIRSCAPSHPIPERLDAVQSELQEGPCLESIRQERIVRAPVFDESSPWPGFAARALDEGVRSMLAFQLFVEVDSLGALNLYSVEPRAFTRDSEEIGSALAAHASLALAYSQRQGQLFEAVSSRDLIGQAKGILMERHKINEHDAFHVLTAASSRSNRKLHSIAEELVATGILPGAATG